MARKQRKYHFIYKTTNILTNRYYIGMHSTDNLNDGYLGSGKRLRYSINKYGKENHIVEIIEFCTSREELKNREKEIVNLNEIAKNECLNLIVGGEGGRGFTNEEQKQNAIKSNQRQKWLKENNKEWNEKRTKQLKENGSNVLTKLWKEGKLSAPNWTGKQHKEETKLKIGLANSLKQKGEYNSQFGSQWITNGEQNKKIKMMGIVPTGWKLGRTPKK
jgi:hypothetical protein